MAWKRWQVVLAAVAGVAVTVSVVASRLRAPAPRPAIVRGPGPAAGDGRAGPPVDAASPTYRLTGQVLDPQGAPAEGALVSVVTAHGAGVAPAWRPVGELGVYTGPLPTAREAARLQLALATSARAGAAGRFAIDGVPAGPALVVAEIPGRARGELELVVAAHTAGITVALSPLPPIPDGGAAPALAGPTVPPPVPVLVRDARTGGIIRGARTRFAGGIVHVEAARYAPADVALPPDARELVVELELSATVAGRVLDGRGDPVAGATVEAGGSSASTDGRGEFVLRGVKPGTLTVHARAGDRAAETEVTVLPGEQRRDLDLRFAGP